MRSYTGAWIAKQNDPWDNRQEIFIIKGPTASVTLASAMISDFLTAAVDDVNTNMKILRRIVDGEVAQPCGYAQGSGFMTFYCEQPGPKVPPPPPTTSKPSLTMTAISSPEKCARMWPSLVSQVEFEEYLLHTVDEGDEQMMLDQKALEAEIRAMVMTSSDDDIGHTSSDDAVSVGPLECVEEAEEDRDQAVSVDPMESSHEFWARRAHSRLDTTSIVEDKTTEDTSAVDDPTEISEDEGWTMVSYKRSTVKGTDICRRGKRGTDGVNLGVLGDEMKETLERLILEGKFSRKDLNSRVVATLGKLSEKERMLAVEQYEEALHGTVGTIFSKQGYLMGIVNRMLGGRVAHAKPAPAATQRASTFTLADFLV